MSEEIKQTIITIVNENPKHYTRIIKKQDILNLWVINNSYECENYSERIYVSIYGLPDTRKCGKYPKFNTYFKGFFEYCGSKSKCECSRSDHSEIISNYQNIKTPEEKYKESLKKTNTMLERYGVINAMHSEKIREKHKQTNIERYGVDNPLQNNDIYQQTLVTKKQKYGENYMDVVREKSYQKYNGNPFSSPIIQEQIKQTMLEKHGIYRPLESNIFKEKSKQTNLEKYGVENPLSNDQIREQIKQTNIEKYGVENPLSNDQIREQIKQTNLEKYGTPYSTQSHLSNETINIINNKELFCEFIKDKTVYNISKYLGTNVSTIYDYIKKYNAQDLYQKRGPTYLEEEMQEFLDNNNISYIINDRNILNGKELDFYIPEYNMAIEMNGVYWHSDAKNKDKNSHYNKWKECNDLGIHLVSIFEDEWNNQNIILHNMLLNHFNKKPKGTPARKTTIQQISGKIARSFLDQYHLQGYVSGKHYGAFDSLNKLIGVMTFGYTRNQRFELSRFVMDNYSHPGLFSKLFKYAQNDIKFTEVVSFSDNKHFTGNVYKMNGFDFIQVIRPDYKYLVNGIQIHKSNYRKSNIKKKYPHMIEMIDSGMVEKEAMEYLGIPRIYDCGKCEWVWKECQKK